jgi:predicted DCC family thiol-disulfide oxidoreductase YuxK
MEHSIQKTIIFFDAECILCNSSVAFILKQEKNKTITFCSLQSDIGKQKTNAFLNNKALPNSLIFLNNGKVFTKSDAVLHICKYLKGLFPVLFCFIIIPAFLRNLIYDWVAKNRYNWFGKQNECILPNSSNKDRFIL